MNQENVGKVNWTRDFYIFNGMTVEEISAVIHLRTVVDEDIFTAWNVYGKTTPS